MLITIRHGRTDYNERRIFSGTGDAPRITEEAHLQAYSLGKKLEKYNIDVAVISPLTRAKETFEEINKSLNINMEIENLLIERDFKEYESKEIALLDSNIYWDMDKSDQYDIEDIEDFASRIEKALNNIKNKYPNENVLIIAHSGVCRAIKYIVEGKVNRHWQDYSMENLRTYIYEKW